MQTGPKPKPLAVHLVEGTVNATRHARRLNEPQPDGRPERPRFVKGRAHKIWDQYLPIGYWLTSAESHVFGQWCVMTADLEKDSDKSASWLGQWRAFASELGFTQAGRARLGVRNETKIDGVASKYLTRNAS